jgi:hypothetical protein
VLIIISIIRSSDDSEALSAEAQSKSTMYDEDLESQPSSLNQSVESLIGDFEQEGLVQLQKELENLTSKQSSTNEYLKFHEDYDEPVIFSRKIELNSRKYPWLKKLQKLLILDKKIGPASDELKSFFNRHKRLKKIFFSDNINNKDDISSQTIKIVNAKPLDLPALSTSPKNNEDLPFNNIAKKAKSSVDKQPNQLDSPKNFDPRMVFDEQQGSLETSTPSVKNGANIFSPQNTDPDSSNIKISYELSTTHPKSDESASLSQNSSTRLDITPKHLEQLRNNVLSVESEQQFNKTDQDFGINTKSAELSEKAITNLNNDLLSQRPQILTDKITDYSGAPITQNAVKKLEIKDFKSKPDKTLRLSKTDFEVQGDKSRRANSIKGENETSTYRKNTDPVKVKDKQKVKKNKKKSKSKKRHKKKVNNRKASKTKKKSKKHFKQKKKVAAVKKQDERDISNLQMGDDPNIYSLFETIMTLILQNILMVILKMILLTISSTRLLWKKTLFLMVIC